jgi:hypothetical protein
MFALWRYPTGGEKMSDWFHDLPVPWMAFLIFGFTYLIAGMVYAVVSVLTVGERARAFKAVSPSMLMRLPVPSPRGCF